MLGKVFWWKEKQNTYLLMPRGFHLVGNTEQNKTHVKCVLMKADTTEGEKKKKSVKERRDVSKDRETLGQGCEG